MSNLKHKIKLSKKDYITYRQKLQARKISSYIDQFGKTYTACKECTNSDCKIKELVNGCMQGTPHTSILKMIER